MELFKAVGDDEQDPGQWFDFTKGPDGVAFKVRRIPGAVARRIGLSKMGAKRMMTAKGTPVDTRDVFAARLAQASYALLDTRNFEVRMGGPKAAERYATAVNDAGIKADDLVKLDARWNDAVKELVLEDWPTGVDFIHECLEKLEDQARSVEAEALGNS